MLEAFSYLNLVYVCKDIFRVSPSLNEAFHERKRNWENQDKTLRLLSRNCRRYIIDESRAESPEAINVTKICVPSTGFTDRANFFSLVSLSAPDCQQIKKQNDKYCIIWALDNHLYKLCDKNLLHFSAKLSLDKHVDLSPAVCRLCSASLYHSLLFFFVERTSRWEI